MPVYDSVVTSNTYRDRGTWDFSATYLANDLVNYEGTPYVCVASHTSSLPYFDPSFWTSLLGAGTSLQAAPPTGIVALDTAVISSRLSLASLQGGGRVQLQGGTYVVNTNSIVIPASCVLVGAGIKATEIRAADGSAVDSCIIDLSGTDETTGRKERAQCRDVRINGKDSVGSAQSVVGLRSYYTSQSHIQNVEIAFCFSIGLDMVNVWDTNIDNLFLDWCGDAAGTNPALWVRNSSAASGFGFAATQQTNMIRFTSLRIESFCRAFRFERGTGSSLDPYGIFVNGIKCETTRIRSEVCRVQNVRHITIDDFEIAADSFDSGVSTPVIGIFWSPTERSKLTGVRLHQPGNFVNQLVNAFIPTSGSHEISNLESDPSATNPSVALVVWGANGPCDVRGLSIGAGGTLHSGATPMLPSVAAAAALAVPREADVINVTGTAAISSFTGMTIGRPLTIIFSSTASVVHNGTSIILALGLTFAGTANDTLTVVSDGSVIREISRTVL